MRLFVLVAALLTAAVAAPALSFEFSGTKEVALETRDGERLPIGHVTFAPRDGAVGFELAVDALKMKDFFLSMREFKCVEGAEVQCHVPYPYANPRTLRPDDLAWLETSLLFLFKPPSEFGAKLANGIYYVLAPDGDSLVGAPHAIDLNQIAAPPDDPTTPPFAPNDREPVPAGDRWIARLVIR